MSILSLGQGGKDISPVRNDRAFLSVTERKTAGKTLAVRNVGFNFEICSKDRCWDNDAITFFHFVFLFHCRVPSDGF